MCIAQTGPTAIGTAQANRNKAFDHLKLRLCNPRSAISPVIPILTGTSKQTPAIAKRNHIIPSIGLSPLVVSTATVTQKDKRTAHIVAAIPASVYSTSVRSQKSIRKLIASTSLRQLATLLIYPRYSGATAVWARSLIFFAGTPAYTPNGSKSFVAIDPSPRIAPFPRFTPGDTIAFAHTHE